MKLYRYSVVGEIIEWVNNDIIEKWTAKEIIIAENEWQAIDMFTDAVLDKTSVFVDENCDVDIDDVRCKCLGPAPVFISVRLESYVPVMENTMTVGELVEYLDENFDPDANIYLGYYGGMVAQYSGITKDSVFVEEEEVK